MARAFARNVAVILFFAVTILDAIRWKTDMRKTWQGRAVDPYRHATPSRVTMKSRRVQHRLTTSTHDIKVSLKQIWTKASYSATVSSPAGCIARSISRRTRTACALPSSATSAAVKNSPAATSRKSFTRASLSEYVRRRRNHLSQWRLLRWTGHN